MEQGEGHQPAALPATRLPPPHENPHPHSNPQPHSHHHPHLQPHHLQARPRRRCRPHSHPSHSPRPGRQQQQQQQQQQKQEHQQRWHQPPRRHRLPGSHGLGRSLPWLGLPLPLLLLLLVAGGGVLVQGSYERTCTVATRLRGPHRLGICGENIPQALKLLCFSDGYNGYRGKREVGDVLDHKAAATAVDGAATATESEGVASSIRDLLLNKQEAFTYLRSRQTRGAGGDGTPLSRRRRHGYQGITCECCYNKCTVRELRQYCRRDED